MNITPEEKVWTVVEAIADALELAPSGANVLIDPTALISTVSSVELQQLLDRMAKDEKVIEIKFSPVDSERGLIVLRGNSTCYEIAVSDHVKFREFLNRAHSQHYGDINRLAAENFLAVCDVAMDICAALQLVEGQQVHIPLIPNIVRFSTLMPADGINMRDGYCDFRWKALMYLRDRGHIEHFEIRNKHYLHRWEQEIDVLVDRYDFDKFYKKLEGVYERRVVEPQKKQQKKEPKPPKVPSTPTVQKIEITAMPELQVRNVEDTTIAKGKKRVHLPHFKPTDWGKIIIRFIDEQNVVIIADKEQIPSNYEALGFADDKRGKPNTAWGFLRGLADHNGETLPLPTPIPDNIKQHKRQLADRLKTIFKNDTDPFYEPTDTRTYRIKITVIPPTNERESLFEEQEFLTEE